MTSAKGANASAVAKALLVFAFDGARFGWIAHKKRQYTERGGKLLISVAGISQDDFVIDSKLKPQLRYA
jgi:hypothetical protein